MKVATKTILKRLALILLLIVLSLSLFLHFAALERKSRLNKLISEHSGHLKLIEYLVESRYREYLATLNLLISSQTVIQFLDAPSPIGERQVEELFKRIADNRPYITSLVLKDCKESSRYQYFVSLEDSTDDIEECIGPQYWDSIEQESYVAGTVLSSPLLINYSQEEDTLDCQIILRYPLFFEEMLDGQLIMVVDGSDILDIIETFLADHPSEMGFLLFSHSGTNILYHHRENIIEYVHLTEEANDELFAAAAHKTEGHIARKGNEFYFTRISPDIEQILFSDEHHFATAMFFFVAKEVSILSDSIFVSNKYLRWGIFSLVLGTGVAFLLVFFSRRDDRKWLKLNNIVFEKSHDGVIIADAQSNPLFVNRTYRLMSSYSTKEIKASPHTVISLAGESLDPENFEDFQSLVWVKGKRHTILLDLKILSPVDTNKDDTFIVFHYSNPINIGDLVVEKSLSAESEIDEIEHYPLLLLSAIKRRQTECIVASLKFTNMGSIESQYSIDEQLLLSSQVRKRIWRAFDHIETILQYALDHYLLVLPASTETYEHLLTTLAKLFEDPFDIKHNVIKIECQIGLSNLSTHEEAVETLLRQSRIALASLRTSETSEIVQYTDELSEKMLREFEILQRFPEAIQSESIEVHYQPIVSLKSGKIVSAEALSRWEDPYLGTVSPGEFVPIIEYHGFGNRLAQYVVQNACALLGALKAQVPISINLGYNELQDATLLNFIIELLHTCNIAPNQLGIELTERTLMTDSPDLKDVLDQFRKHNITISMDDFGIGFSSLSTLHSLEIDVIKIDRSFIQDYPATDTGVILKAMVRMAKELGIPTLLEGIETVEQLRFAKTIGVDLYQGFYFSQAIPKAAFIDLWKQHTQAENRTP